MKVAFLSTHLDSALSLYRQRVQQQQVALVDAQLMARQEQLLLTHLHVLSRCAPLDMKPGKEAEFFVDPARRFLSPMADVQQEGYDLVLSLLQETGPAREGAFQALALLPPPEKDARLLDLYRQDKTLRPMLFDLWRKQSWPVPEFIPILKHFGQQHQPQGRQNKRKLRSERMPTSSEIRPTRHGLAAEKPFATGGHTFLRTCNRRNP